MLYMERMFSRARLVFLLVAAFLLPGCGSSEARSRAPLTVVTWNIEWFPGRSPKATPEQAREHMRQAQAALRELDPDVLLLQEVRDMAAAVELCRAVPGLTVHVTSDFPGSSQNLVIASKLQADSGWFDRWRAGPVHPPRGYAFTALQLPRGHFLLTYSLHLKSNAAGNIRANIAQRNESSRQLLPHIEKMLGIYSRRGACAVLVGGDFNTSVEDQRFQTDMSLRALLAAGLQWTFTGVPFAERITVPAEGSYPDNTFDHVLISGFGKPQARVRKYPTVSDHRPVVVGIGDFDGPARFDAKAGFAALQPTVPEALEASEREAIRRSIGREAAVMGRVQSVRSPGGKITFLNFAGSPRGEFVGIIRTANLPTLLEGFGVKDLKDALEGRNVELRGVITSFRGTPQIEVSSAAQLRVLP